MSGDDEGPAFRLPLNVPNPALDPETRRQAIEWLQALADQLAEEDGKTLSIQVTGVYVDNYDDDDYGVGVVSDAGEDAGEDTEEDADEDAGEDGGEGEAKKVAKKKAAKKKAAKKAAVNVMLCPGRRPYGS